MLKEKYNALVEKAAADEEMGDVYLGALENCLASFSDYIMSIYNMEYLIPIMRYRLDGEELRDYISGLDTRRRACHNAAIASINMLHRLANAVGAEPLTEETFDGDNPVQRRAAANFCARMVMEIIYDQVSTGIDDAIDFLSEHKGKA